MKFSGFHGGCYISERATQKKLCVHLSGSISLVLLSLDEPSCQPYCQTGSSTLHSPVTQHGDMPTSSEYSIYSGTPQITTRPLFLRRANPPPHPHPQITTRPLFLRRANPPHTHTPQTNWLKDIIFVPISMEVSGFLTMIQSQTV